MFHKTDRSIPTTFGNALKAILARDFTTAKNLLETCVKSDILEQLFFMIMPIRI